MSDTPPTLYCANHPGVETTLRCNRCEKPICSKCAVLTPTGYRCKECVRGQQKLFETAQWYDYPIIIVVVGVLSFLGSWLATFIGFFTILLAPAAGFVIAEAARLVTQRRRSKNLFLIASITAGLAALPFVIRELLTLTFGGFGGLLGLLWLGIYLFVVPSTVYARLRGISMR
ncbi:MAG: putative rane protein [Chloroflexi bacterium]|nr:putative rane protein [Chloroflexota bacterium]